MWQFFLEYIADNACHCYDFYNGLKGQGEDEDVIIFNRPKANCDNCWQMDKGGAIIFLILDWGTTRIQELSETTTVDTKPRQ